MLRAKRILGALIVLGVCGYLAFEAGIFADPKASREIATSFCNKVTAGQPATAAISLARENVTERRLHVEVDEMVVSFRGSCDCLIKFKGGNAYPQGVFCSK